MASNLCGYHYHEIRNVNTLSHQASEHEDLDCGHMMRIIITAESSFCRVAGTFRHRKSVLMRFSRRAEASVAKGLDDFYPLKLPTVLQIFTKQLGASRLSGGDQMHCITESQLMIPNGVNLDSAYSRVVLHRILLKSAAKLKPTS